MGGREEGVKKSLIRPQCQIPQPLGFWTCAGLMRHVCLVLWAADLTYYMVPPWLNSEGILILIHKHNWVQIVYTAAGLVQPELIMIAIIHLSAAPTHWVSPSTVTSTGGIQYVHVWWGSGGSIIIIYRTRVYTACFGNGGEENLSYYSLRPKTRNWLYFCLGQWQQSQ